MKLPIRLVLLISGGGTTMEQILLACYNGILKELIEPVLVIASKDNIGGIQRAIDAGFDPSNIAVCGRQMYASDEKFGNALLGLLGLCKIDVIGQYGWLPLTPENVIVEYDRRIINQHPGPLDSGRPDFGGPGMYGRRVHCARLYFARESGLEHDQFTEATTHYVSPKFDEGWVIGKTEVAILPSDDVISLQQRVLPAEHQLQIDVLKQFAEGTVAPQFRSSPLILGVQYKLLEESKRVAGLLFPKG